MRFGCCTNMIATKPDGLGVEFVEKLAEIGYDYIELSNRDLMNLNDQEFLALSDRIKKAGIQCEANNNFFPGSIKLTGNNVDLDRVLEYVKRSFERLSRLNSKVIVFGSADARNIEAGFFRDKAWNQLVELLREIDIIAQQYNIVVAIEHLNKSESNIVNTTSEALRLAEEVAGRNVKVLLDYYHLMLEEEDLEIINKAGEYIKHVHFSEVRGRTFPRNDNSAYEQFFMKLHEINYDGNISIEAYVDRNSTFEKEAKDALVLLRKLAKIRK